MVSEYNENETENHKIVNKEILKDLDFIGPFLDKSYNKTDKNLIY
ncbi:hypothetical protein LEP1GSC060_1882 [Leptospira weilii serovar Ranarum str. ICFT]|uniref:Uncharacterized protein n=1 Tax=Leptospira weilii serovar Ranarum str. ICFT TaxID=1218598 RepID=N1WLP1_9LEPT|nr:hypothetical protein LEP1GSC060_1882 [Leptospira weilii serovar Ranarum str. ICFT]